MKAIPIGIIGGGAMGAMAAALFHHAGHTPVIYELDPVRTAALTRGLELTMDGKTATLPITASTAPTVLSGADPLFFFVKSFATESAARDIAPLVSPDATVVTLQNGIGNDAVLSRHFGRRRVVFGTTALGATMRAPGSIQLCGKGPTVIGGEDQARVDAIRALLDGAGIAVTVTDDPAHAVWEKAVINAGINPLAALLGVANGYLADNDAARELQEAVVREAVSVAQSAGMAMDAETMVAATLRVCRATSANRCSMLQDLDRGAPTEIGYITGAIVDAAQIHGTAAPLNNALFHLIRARESLARNQC